VFDVSSNLTGLLCSCLVSS